MPISFFQHAHTAEGIKIAEKRAEIILNFLAYAMQPNVYRVLHSEAEDISASSEHFERSRC
jgi:hypothetical protein